MRSYNQYCALAKALDIVGDRWTLLLVREMLTEGRRYKDLQSGLPGIPSNLLASRLNHLQEAGVVGLDDHGRYALTPWGRELSEPMNALAVWAAPLMDEMSDTDTFQSSWLGFPVAFFFGGVDEARPACSVEIRAGSDPVSLESSDGAVRFRRGSAESPSLVLTGKPDVVIGILSGRLDQDAAKALGASFLGDYSLLSQLRRVDLQMDPAAKGD